jgi:hypothetical protein
MIVLSFAFVGAAVPATNTSPASTEAMLNLIGDAPVFGHGFSVALAPVRIDNQYLTIGAEAGLIALGGFLIVIAAGITTARDARRRTHDPDLRQLAAAVLAAITALAVGALGANVLVLPITAGLLFANVGLAGAVARVARRVESRRRVEAPV